MIIAMITPTHGKLLETISQHSPQEQEAGSTALNGIASSAIGTSNSARVMVGYGR